LQVEPRSHFLNWQQDPFGNWQARVVFPDWAARDGRDGGPRRRSCPPSTRSTSSSRRTASAGRSRTSPALARDLQPYLQADATGPRLRALVGSIPRTPRLTVELLVELNQRLQRDVRYLIRPEPGVQTPEETLAAASGSCRDSAWLLVQCLRQLGIAARFVSGYLIQLKPDVRSLDGPTGAESDFTDLHAWAEAFVPGAGWLGLDPTSGLFAAEGHVPLAATPDPRTAAPITGSVDECEVDFSHRMTVTRLAESPRSTRPFSEEQWAGDRRARGGGRRSASARATCGSPMGGEPTFVSLDDMEGAEWNVAAVGPTKEGLAATLLERLRQRFAPDGVITVRPGQVVSGRIAARAGRTRSTGAAMASRSGGCRLRHRRRHPRTSSPSASSSGSRGGWGVDPRVRAASVRGRLPLRAEGAPAADERRPARQPAPRPGRARAARARVRERTRYSARLGPSGAALAGPLVERAVGVPGRRALPGPG
jgi:transglutaminase-like putative cysteine protease